MFKNIYQLNIIKKIIQEYSTKFHGKTGQCSTKTSEMQ